MLHRNFWINNINIFLWLCPKFSKMNEKSNIIRQTHDKSVDEVSYKSGQATHLWNHLFGLAFLEKGGALCEFLRRIKVQKTKKCVKHVQCNHLSN